MSLDNTSAALLEIAKKAGAAIMEIYRRDFAVVEKDDTSPLTEADIAAHKIIVSELAKFSPLPVLSEESSEITWSQRKQWSSYWLVDPLDGTKEFIKKNGEFTVNIALIENHHPVRGVVYAPALDKAYVGHVGEGAWVSQSGVISQIQAQKHVAGETWRVVGSRSHQSPDIQRFLTQLDGPFELIAMGSSLKLCLVAEGKADLYPRLGPTSEWDTAAAHAVASASGATVSELVPNATGFECDKPLRYNTKESLLNPFFLVSA